MTSKFLKSLSSINFLDQVIYVMVLRLILYFLVWQIHVVEQLAQAFFEASFYSLLFPAVWDRPWDTPAGGDDNARANR